MYIYMSVCMYVKACVHVCEGVQGTHERVSDPKS